MPYCISVECTMAWHMGRLIGIRFNVSDCGGTRGSLEFVATLLYSRDLTTLHLDCAIIQKSAMSGKWNPPQ